MPPNPFEFHPNSEHPPGAILEVRKALPAHVKSYIENINAQLSTIYAKYDVANVRDLAKAVEQLNTTEAYDDLEHFLDLWDAGKKSMEMRRTPNEDLYYYPRELKSVEYKINYKEIDILEGHTNTVFTLQALPDGRIVSGSCDNSIRIWSKQGNEWTSETLEGHTSTVYTLQVLPDGSIISGGGDCTIRIWTKQGDGWESEILGGHEGPVLCLQALPDGRIVSGSRDKTIRIWDGEPVKKQQI